MRFKGLPGQGPTLPHIPVITASGIDYNNDALMLAGADYKSSKGEFWSGAADELLRRLLA